MTSHAIFNRLAGDRSGASSAVLRRAAGLVAGLGLLTATARAQTTWHVDDSASPGGNGLSWATAMDSLQDALDVVSIGDEIWVAEGTYYPTDLGDPMDARSARFWLHEPFELYGGFDGTETSLSQRDPTLFDDTILSGDIGTPSDPVDNAYQVVLLSTTFVNNTDFALLDGFRITLGHNDAGQGGGIRAQGAIGGYLPKLRLRNCIVNDNHAFRGGGLSTMDGAIVYVDRSTFQGNTAPRGAGIHATNLGVFRAANCRFTGNKSTNLGGALYSDAQAQGLTVFANCIFDLNDARLGAVAYIRGTAQYGGEASWFNCTLAENEASEVGGAIYAITTTTVPGKAHIYNSILWDNSAPASPEIFGTGLDVQYTDVEGGYSGTGNVNVNPGFLSDYRTGAGAAVNDAGSNSLIVSDFADLDGDADTGEALPRDYLESARRVNDTMAADTGSGSAPIVDMGAYEVDPGRN